MGTELAVVDKSAVPAVSGFEVAITAREAASIQEIQGSIMIAKRFPRNELEAFEALIQMSRRLSFAEAAAYRFPRGDSTITGPSVNLARAAARVWRNIRYGVDIIHDDEDRMHIEGWAWDIETNTKITAPDSFKKLIYRKKGGWVKPDERDLRELVNRRGAFLERNCLLKLLPKDLIEDAINTCNATIVAGIKGDPEKNRKRTVVMFGDLGIKASELDKYLGKPIKGATPEELAELQKIAASIRDGQSKWSEYVEPASGDDNHTANMDDLMNPKDGTTEEDRRLREKKNKETAEKQGKNKPAETQSEKPSEAKPTVQAGAGADDMFDGEDAPPIEELQATVVAILENVKEAIIRRQMQRFDLTLPEDIGDKDELARFIADNLSYSQLNEYIDLLKRGK